MDAKYGFGVLGWLLALVLLALFILDDAYTWLEQGALPGAEFLIAGLVVFALLAIGFQNMRTHRPPPGH